MRTRWLLTKTAWGCFCASLALCTLSGSPPARAETVAQDLITILESSGQLTAEQADALRAKAEQERQDLEATIREEIQVNADVLADDGYMEFDEVGVAADETLTSKLAHGVEVGGYIQVLKSWRLEDDDDGDLVFDGSSDLLGTDSFRIRRARLEFTGKVGDRTKYKFQFDADNHTDVDVNEAYMEHAFAFFDDGPADGTKIRVGLHKAHTSRERTYSSSKRTTIGRAILHDDFLPNRQIGITIYNDSLMDGNAGAWFGIMNGDSNEQRVNENNSFLLFGRGEYRFEPTADSEATAGLFWFWDDNTGAPTRAFETAVDGSVLDIEVDGQRAAVGADFAMEMGRFFFDVNFVYGFLDGDTSGAALGASKLDASDLVVGDAEFWTINIRKAYFVVEDTWQVAGMFEYGDFDDIIPNGDYWAYTLGVNYYGLEKYRSVVRINWVHLEHNNGAFGPNAASNESEDFLVTEWQVKF